MNSGVFRVVQVKNSADGAQTLAGAQRPAAHVTPLSAAALIDYGSAAASCGISRNPTMTQPVAQRFPTPAIDSLPHDIRTRLLAVQEKSGFVPNVFLTLAYRPDEFRAFFAYHDALMEKDGGLSKAERELIVVA